MRIGRVLALLLLLVALGGTLSGGAAGPAPLAAAAADAATGLAPVYGGASTGPPAAVGGDPAVPVAVPESAPAPEIAAAQRTAGVRATVTRVVVEPAPVVATAPGLAPGTPCRATVRACIDRANNQAWLISGGEISYGPVPITHGRRGHRTPAGTFDVDFHSRNHVSSIYDAPMPYSVFFNGGIAFHQGSLRELSHGCIHLARSAAREFFSSLSRGDTVQVV